MLSVSLQFIQKGLIQLCIRWVTRSYEPRFELLHPIINLKPPGLLYVMVWHGLILESVNELRAYIKVRTFVKQTGQARSCECTT